MITGRVDLRGGLHHAVHRVAYPVQLAAGMANCSALAKANNWATASPVSTPAGKSFRSSVTSRSVEVLPAPGPNDRSREQLRLVATFTRTRRVLSMTWLKWCTRASTTGSRRSRSTRSRTATRCRASCSTELHDGHRPAPRPSRRPGDRARATRARRSAPAPTSRSDRDAPADSRPFVDALERLMDTDRPTIAAVNGAVRAGGIGLMAACDLVVVHESTTFALHRGAHRRRRGDHLGADPAPRPRRQDRRGDAHRRAVRRRRGPLDRARHPRQPPTSTATVAELCAGIRAGRAAGRRRDEADARTRADAAARRRRSRRCARCPTSCSRARRGQGHGRRSPRSAPSSGTDRRLDRRSPGMLDPRSGGQFGCRGSTARSSGACQTSSTSSRRTVS